MCAFCSWFNWRSTTGNMYGILCVCEPDECFWYLHCNRPVINIYIRSVEADWSMASKWMLFYTCRLFSLIVFAMNFTIHVSFCYHWNIKCTKCVVHEAIFGNSMITLVAYCYVRSVYHDDSNWRVIETSQWTVDLTIQFHSVMSPRFRFKINEEHFSPSKCQIIKMSNRINYHAAA